MKITRFRNGSDRSWHSKVVPDIYRTIRDHFGCSDIVALGNPSSDQRDFDVMINGPYRVAIRINHRPKNSGELNFKIDGAEIADALSDQDYLWIGWPGSDQRLTPNIHDYLIGDVSVLRLSSRKANFHYDRDSNCIATIKLVSLPGEFVLKKGIVSAGPRRSGRCVYHKPENYVDTTLPNGMIRTSCSVCGTWVGNRPSPRKPRDRR